MADGTEEPKRADKNSFFKFFQENFECLYPVVESKIAALLKEFKSVVDDAGSGHLPASKVDAYKRAVTELESVIRRYESACFAVVSVLIDHLLWVFFNGINNNPMGFGFLACRKTAFLCLHLCTCP
jgi:hypothetical protein